MKKHLTLVLCLFLGVGLNAQVDCKPYLPTEEGATWEITNYNAKGKNQGKTVYELIEKVVDGNQITFKVNHTSYDKKGEETFSNSFTAECVDGQFMFDMAYKMNGEMQSFQNMDIAVDASDFEVPEFGTPAGTALADGSLTVGLVAGNALALNMKVDITERMVEAEEEITTPAGTYNCMVLKQKVSTKMVIKVNGSSKEWYAEGVGMVRSESYNKKGKLLGYSELTSISQ